MNMPTGKDTSVKVQYQLLQLAQSMGIVPGPFFMVKQPAVALKFLCLVRSFCDVSPKMLVSSIFFPHEGEGWQELRATAQAKYEKAVAASQAAESSCAEANELVQIAGEEVVRAEQNVKRVYANYEKLFNLYEEHLRQKEALRKKRDAVRSTVEVFDRGKDKYIATMNSLSGRIQSDEANAEDYKVQIEHTKQLRRHEYFKLQGPRKKYRNARKTVGKSKSKVENEMIRLDDAYKELYAMQYLQQQAVKACADWSDELLRRQELCKMWYSLIAEMEKLYSVWSEWNITNGSDHTISPSVIDQCDTVTAPVDSDSAAATATGGHSSSNACTVSEPPVERTRDWSESVDKNPTQGIPTVSA